MKKVLSLLSIIILLLLSTSCKTQKDISSQTSSIYSKPSNTLISKSQDTSEIDNVSSEIEFQQNSEVEVPKNNKSPVSSPSTSSGNDTQTKPNSNNTVPTTSEIKPKVIASRCQHSYTKPSCTAPLICSKCHEAGPSQYEGEKISFNHQFVDKKCQTCGYVSTLTQDNYVEFSGSFYETNKEITIDVLLLTLKKNITMYLNISFYKYENNDWQPYEGLYTQGEFFGLVAIPGEVLISETGVKYGRWDYLSNEILQKDPSAIVESDFSEGRLIRRFKVTFPEPGTYKCEVSEGKTPSQEKMDIIVKTFVV